MELIIAIIAIILVGLPVATAGLRIIYALFSGFFNLFGKIFLVVLALVGLYFAFVTGPIGWIVAFIVFIFFKAAKN